jgi:cell division protein FtsZ
MTINLKVPDVRELKPRITVFGVGGAGGNAVNNMIEAGLQGVDFVVANTDAQALSLSKAERIVQMGVQVTEGLGAGSQPEVGRAAAEEVIEEIRDHLQGVHMVFVTAGMGGGTGTGAAPVIARVAREVGILTVGVVTKPFHFEGLRRMRIAESGITELQKSVDTLIVIPNQNLFRVANDKTTFADAFAMADQVLYSGVASITDLMVKPGLINLDFADVRAVMREMGKAMMGTGEASGDRRAILAAEAAIANPLLDDVSMKGARGLLISITGGPDMMLYELDEAATRIREEVDPEANIILGATQDPALEGMMRVSVVATGIDSNLGQQAAPSQNDLRLAEMTQRLRQQSAPAPARPAVVPPAPAQGADRMGETHAAAQPQTILAETNDVTLRPLAAKPSLFVEPLNETRTPAPAEPPPGPEAFIPPPAERATVRPPRMPRIEDLPIPAQAQIAAAQRDVEPAQPPPAGEKKRMTLLQRLAAVGLGRKEEEGEEAQPAPAKQADTRLVPAQRPAATAPAPEIARRPPAPATQPAYRPAAGQLDAHGRAQNAARAFEDDQLEIPAFLRRHSN